jgi:glucokinase
MDKRVYIGADIGGSHISVAGVEADTRKICTAVHRKQISADIDAESFIGILNSLIALSLSETNDYNLQGICCAFPSAFDYKNGIAQYDGSNNKFQKLLGLNVRKSLTGSLAVFVPVSFCNDAHSFSLGEYALLPNTQMNMMAITLGSGFGSSFINDYRLLCNTDKSIPNNGELYNWPYKSGVAEDYFSSKALIDGYFIKSGIRAEGVKQIKMAAENNDLDAIELFESFGTDLGNFLLHWAQRSHIEVIVIGGSISGAWDFFYPSLIQVFSDATCTCKVNLSDHPEEASIRGAVFSYITG